MGSLGRAKMSQGCFGLGKVHSSAPTGCSIHSRWLGFTLRFMLSPGSFPIALVLTGAHMGRLVDSGSVWVHTGARRGLQVQSRLRIFPRKRIGVNGFIRVRLV